MLTSCLIAVMVCKPLLPIGCALLRAPQPTQRRRRHCWACGKLGCRLAGCVRPEHELWPWRRDVLDKMPMLRLLVQRQARR